MIPHKQLNRHDPENGIWGDCARTVWACLLDLESPAEVPHFFDKGVSTREGNEAERAWLAARGLYPVAIPFQGDLAGVMTTMRHTNPGLTFILTGESRNGTGHVVLCRDGEIVHDPSPLDTGIIGPSPDDGMFWVTFLGKLT